MHELDEELYYTIDEKARNIDLPEKGRELMSPAGPGAVRAARPRRADGGIEGRRAISIPSSASPSATEIYRDYGERTSSMHNIQRCSRPTRCTRRTSTTSSRTARSLIVDEFTGRLMPGRRYSDGLHQAHRGQGGRARRGGDPDARHDHAPELLPHVRQARRHDRHRRDRGGRVLGDLQARRAGDPDQPADPARGSRTTSSPDEAREVQRGGRGDRRVPRAGPAGARGHDPRRGQRAALAHAQAPRHPAQRPERQVPPAGGRDRGHARASAAR